MVSYFTYSTNNHVSMYDYLSMVSLPSEPNTIYISLSDNNDHHPHDNDHWIGIAEYKAHGLYAKGEIVYFNYIGGIIYCRSIYDDNYNHPENDGWKCSNNLQDLGVIPMVTNTISPPRHTPINLNVKQKPVDRDVEFLLDKLQESLTKEDYYYERSSACGIQLVSYSNEIRGPKGQQGSEISNTITKRINDHPTFNKTKKLYMEALKVETRKRGHSETSRIKSRWGTELDIIEEFIIKGKKLPENTNEALDRVYNELLKYIESAGVWVETTNSYIDINTMIDVMLHPAK